MTHFSMALSIMAQVQHGAFQYGAFVPMKSRPVRAVIQKEDALFDLRSD